MFDKIKKWNYYKKTEVIKKEVSVQKWIKIKNIINNNIIQTKDDKFIKIIKVYPINYELKSELERNSILNSFKVFLTHAILIYKF